MEMITYIIVGWVTGLLSRAIVPGPQHLGLIRLMLIGMVGGVAGGIVGGTFNVRTQPFTVGIPSLVGAFLGAAIVIFVVVGLSRNRARA